MSLAKKTALLTTIGVVLAVVVLGFLSLRAVNQATDAMLEDRMITAGVVADYLDESLGRAMTELYGVAQTIDGLSITPAFEGKVAALQDIYGRLSVYVKGIYLVNKQGKVVWRATGTPVIGSDNASFDASVSRMLAVDSPRVSPLVQLPVSDSPVVLLTSPTGSGGGEAGVLVVAVDLSQSGIAGFVGPIRLGQTGYVEVVDQNGVVVARTEPGPKLQPFEKSDHSGRFAALIADAKPTRGLCHTCHEPVQIVERRDVLAFMPLTRANWGVAIRQSETEALTAIDKLRRDLLLFGIGLIAAALLLVLLTTRDIVSRISVLKTASKRMASGDLSSPVVSSRQDEVGELGRSFEDMRLRLKRSRDELEGRTQELSSLLSVSEILTAIPDLSNLDTALAGALDRILEVMKAEKGGIFLLDESEVLRCRVQRGLPVELVENGCRKGFLVETITSRRTTVIPDIAKAGEAGFPVEDLRAFAAVPLDAKGQVLGVLSIASLTPREFTAEEVRLLEDIARQAATVIENARLHEKVQQEDQARGELLREIMSIQEEDRRRIARELHDETSQVLASLTANLEAMSEMLPSSNGEDMKIRLKQAQTLSISVLDDVHRLIYELRPTLLDDLGLVAAARWLADNLKSAGIDVDFKTTGRAKRLPPDVEVALFRVIQEALNNIARHAGAKNAALSLRFRKGSISICIKDDGAGFDVEEAIRSKERPRGLGLLGMKERVELVNGTLSIASRPGSGTEIDIEIPLASSV